MCLWVLNSFKVLNMRYITFHTTISGKKTDNQPLNFNINLTQTNATNRMLASTSVSKYGSFENCVWLTFTHTENGGNQVEEGCANVTQAMTVLPGVATVKGGHSRASMDTRSPLHNKLIQKDQNRKTQSYKVESVSGGANMDMHNFSLESKRETEYVSRTQRQRDLRFLKEQQSWQVLVTTAVVDSEPGMTAEGTAHQVVAFRFNIIRGSSQLNT